ncbi:MAG: isochorismatase family cysteine hydrolase [Candidatus Hadarchaeota archaeon]|nr:isochorismatase family cysteine hydrolase [Candidatus Hadarchaeota archaeon]
MKVKTAVLVIDMINDFVTGKLGSERARKIVPDVKKLVGSARSKGLPVIYVCDSHIPGVDAELSLWGDHAIAGTKGAEIVPELEPRDGGYVLRKRRYSAFFATDLDILLRELDIKRLVLSGLVTDICIQHTAADAFFRGYKVVVLEDCVDATSEEDNQVALEYMKKVYGAKVEKLDGFLRSLEG